MLAFAWIALAWVAGCRILRRLAGEPGDLLAGLTGGNARPFAGSPWPPVLFRLAAGLWVGLLPLTWLTFGLAALLSPLLPPAVHPLLVVNTLVLVGGAVHLAQPVLVRSWQRLRGRPQADLPEVAAAGCPDEPPGPARHFTWPSLVRSLRQRTGLFFVLTALFWLLLAFFLMMTTFFRDGSQFRAGYSVFSDFAPHTALVSSFSQGRNWPVEYPHFAGDGIAYHFMFYFLCGNLNFLGLPLDLAINVPSLLGLVTFCLLLGFVALALTGRRSTFFLAPALLFFRSSFAFFTFLGDLAGRYGTRWAAWTAIFRAMLERSAYIGNTTHDDWGLWGVNVYANQRHLLPGLSVALVILILFLPDLRSGMRQRPTLRTLLFSRNFWLPAGCGAWRRLALAALLGILLPYFHGSVLVSLLLILFVLAIFSQNRLSFVLFSAAASLSALLQSRFFAGQVDKVIRPSWHFGFIAADPSLPGILLYLLEMSGILLPLLAVAFWLPGRSRKVLIAAFCLPLLLAFTVSLTPDVTVNHKYIIISFAFANIYIADLLARLAAGGKTPDPAAVSPPPARQRPAWLSWRLLPVLLLGFLLMVTGLQEMIILRNISENTVAIDSRSPLVTWIRSHTSPDAVFVTAPYHYNTFFLSGRAVWLGHAYYAASAGHDTFSRLQLEQTLLGGCEGDLDTVAAIVSQEGLDYLIIDDELRDHPEFWVDEAFFDAHFPLLAAFPGLGNLKIYRLRATGSSG